ncbi:MAG: chemotaxis protein CheA, partial [Aquincola tertiaricarbonis]
THQMETLLDKLRRHELAPNAQMVDVLLLAGDALRAQLARHQGAGGDPVDTTELLFSIRALVEGGSAPVPTAVATVPVAAAPAPERIVDDLPPAAAPAPAAGPGLRQLELTVGPLPRPEQADSLAELFKEIADLGVIEPLDAGRAADGMRRFKITTGSTDNDLLDLFSFHVSREHMKLQPLGPGYGFHEGSPGAPVVTDAPAADPGYGFFDDAPGAPGGAAATANAPAGVPAEVEAAKPAAAAAPRAAKAEAKQGAALDSATLRV